MKRSSQVKALLSLALLSFFSGTMTQKLIFEPYAREQQLGQHQRFLREMEEKVPLSYLESICNMESETRIRVPKTGEPWYFNRLNHDLTVSKCPKGKECEERKVSLKEIANILNNVSTGKRPKKTVRTFPSSKFERGMQMLKNGIQRLGQACHL